jgi:hypothetical protein
MATYVCVFCDKAIKTKNQESFVKHRILGLAHKWAEHECGHESVFAEGQEDSYVSFLYSKDDEAAKLIAKYGFGMWKNKVIFHYLISGSESKAEFKRILKELLEEIDNLLDLKVPAAEEKIHLLIEDKFEPYRELIKQHEGEKQAKKKWSPAPSAT